MGKWEMGTRNGEARISPFHLPIPLSLFPFFPTRSKLELSAYCRVLVVDCGPSQ